MASVRRSAESDESRMEFCTLDIENDPEGRVLCVTLYTGDKLYWFDDWKGYHDFIVDQTDAKFCTIYAHNGGGWDWLSYVDWLYTNNVDLDLSGMIGGSRLICLQCVRKDGKRVSMLDSFCLFWEKLDTVLNRFLGKSKVELDGMLPHEMLASDPTKFREYAEADTIRLYEAIERFHSLIRERICKIPRLGITLASTAMNVFRTMYEGPRIEIPTTQLLKSDLRQCYKGGWVECFKPEYYPAINVYDVNSMYPYVMRHYNMPISGKVTYTDDFRHVEGETAYHKVRIQPNQYPSFGLSTGEHWLSTYEIDHLRQHNPKALQAILDGFRFTKHYPIFAEYVDKLYALRMENKNNAVGGICKLLLNSLYGKFGISSLRESLVRVKSLSELRQRIKEGEITPVNEELGVYSVQTDTPASYEHVGIASTVTSVSRVVLARHMNERTVYCDTDSIHTPDTLTDVGNGLGQLKLEFAGEGVYVGKKLYGLRRIETLAPDFVGPPQDKKKIRVKGVKVGGKYGAEVSFEDLQCLLSGKVKRCVFFSPATPKETIAGKEKPCRISSMERTRTIRMTR